MQSFRGNEIAMVFQEPMTAMNPVMKCGRQVVEAILLHQKDLTSQTNFQLFTEGLLLFFLNLVSPFLNVLALRMIPFFRKKHFSKREKEAKN